jgi:CRISPR-associated protein Csm2
VNNYRGSQGGGQGHPRRDFAGGSSRPHGGHETASPSDEMQALLQTVNLRSPDSRMFDQTAQGIAGILKVPRNQNKSSQVRRFYDEVIRFSDRHRPGLANAEGFARDLPFIRMISAHAAYAETREHVDANFRQFIQSSVRQVENPDDLANFRTLFEAVIGFLPKKN